MMQTFYNTQLGNIAVYEHQYVPGSIPIVFLHGVYLNHELWSDVIETIKSHTVYGIDMPLHGQSTAGIRFQWSLSDCADMLIELLDSLSIEKSYAIGHSWGSMTILRAANKAPHRFTSIGLCNMPLRPASTGKKLQFHLQHLLLPFRSFYTKQVGKSIIAEESLRHQPKLQNRLGLMMKNLSSSDIKTTDKAVILHSDDGAFFIQNLKVPALALKGRQDYVAIAKDIPTTIVKGGHISPWEAPVEVGEWVKRVLSLTGPDYQTIDPTDRENRL